MGNKKSFMKRRLYALSEIPKHLAFNTFIHHGYRSHYSFSECLASLFYLHNETINVYTHGFMVIYLLVGLPLYLTSGSSQINVLSLINFVACVVPFTLSVVYHLFLCHRRGVCLYDKLLSADLFGIAAINCFGYAVPMWVTFACYPQLRAVCITAYILLSCVILRFFLLARTAKQRSKTLVWFFAMRIAVLAWRLLYPRPNTTGNPEAYMFYIAMDVLAVIGSVINFTRIPERWFPGKLDYFINSHQLMHVFVMVGIWCLNEGSHRDINWLMSDNGKQCVLDVAEVAPILQ